MSEYVYLVRRESGAREDYWPVAACRTLEGAKQACAEYVKEYELEMTEDPDGRSDLIPYTLTDGNGGELFVQIMPLGS